ncbi:energy-coupling factor transporter transmembrane component T family protein [Gracilibacillus alcaliphilus]|uniref:energy-coupling factor transporter transmembrane component T family protein n=1 Tax=Gracilibacillus alcaliphilus TaxID=1401441 RepID=UPI001956CEF7|nr:energy-coupling factor transporter transmembrane protein EcfT [Gracilibacillus alcaliphilus]MBM7677372.1 energy-coupling factor transport system permease protein [Gracilibacillus alcaliphilus]
MKSYMIIGQYVPGHSFIHRLDPRTKLMIIFTFVFIVFFANNLVSYSWLTLFAFAAVLLTQLRLGYIIKGITPVWFLIVFTLLLHIIVTKEGPILLEIGSFAIHQGGIERGLMISWRFMLLVLVTSLLTLTTAPMEITDALEMLLGPFKKLRIPVHELALMMSISLRFIPTLLDETEKISKAQASRGVDFRTGSMKSRIYAIVPLLVPLFISAFKRAEDLAMAMEARGYRGSEGRTKLRQLQFKRIDYITAIVYLAVMIMFLFLRQ